MTRGIGLLSCFFGLILTSRQTSSAEVSSSEVAERTHKVLTGIPWAASLQEAKERAQKEKKLVFWLQLVGDLDAGL